MIEPSVTVYIPTRNRRRQLGKCLRGVLAQRGARLEVIVVDDASSDGTPRLLRRMQRRGLIRCLLLEQQGGAQAARNLAVSTATGEYITGADDDDVWLPGRIEAMLAVMRNGAAFVAATDIMDLGNGLSYLQQRPAAITLDAILRRNVVGNQVMTRTDTFRACGPFDVSLPASQDYDFWIRLVSLAGEGVGLPQPLQWVNASNLHRRVSNSRNRRRGVWMVYRKHRPHMTPSQRRAHLFNVMRTLDRPLTLRTALALAQAGDRQRVLLHYLRGLIPVIDRIALAWLARTQRPIILAALSTCTMRKTEIGQ